MTRSAEPHPTLEELEGLVLGGLSAERTRDVVRHLLRGCQACKAKLALYHPGVFQPHEVLKEVREQGLASIRAPGRERLLSRTQGTHEQQVLKLLIKDGLEALSKVKADLQVTPTCEALLERSWALRHDDPTQMVQLSRHAAELLLLGSRDMLLAAQYFEILASFHFDRRLPYLVSSALDIASSLYRWIGARHYAGRVLLSASYYQGALLGQAALGAGWMDDSQMRSRI